jgi:hypothetical protein
MTPRFISALILIATTSSYSPAENWPSFRGPTGLGESAEKDPPLTWSETKNIHWKAP